MAVEAATCNEDIYPGELPMGLSTLLSRGPRSLSVARGCYFSAHVQINVPGPPHVVMFRTQAVGMKSLQAAEWHPSALTADSLLCHQRVNRFYSMFHFHFHINVHCPSLWYFLGSLQIFSHMLLFPLPLSSSLQLRRTP
jgi:hypothetical protein